MAMNTLESGPKLDWTRDNQMYERYRIWRKKVEFIFCSALADSTPKQLVSYLKYWMGDQGIPLIEKWESTGKLDYSNAKETPATEGGRRRALSSGYKVQTYWDLLDEEFKPKGPGRMNIASALPQTEADFFDDKGLPKQYIPQNQQQHTGSMYVLRKFQGNPSGDILFSDNGIEIQHSV